DLPVLINDHVHVIDGISPIESKIALDRIHRVVSADDGERNAVDWNDEVLLAETELADFEAVLEREADLGNGLIAAAANNKPQIVRPIGYATQIERAKRGVVDWSISIIALPIARRWSDVGKGVDWI